LAIAAFFSQHSSEPQCRATRDMKRAYRQLPVCEAHR
jgi:hypothetical protein